MQQLVAQASFDLASTKHRSGVCGQQLMGLRSHERVVEPTSSGSRHFVASNSCQLMTEVMSLWEGWQPASLKYLRWAPRAPYQH
eukprot:6456688-Amphidinium_carterae.1